VKTLRRLAILADIVAFAVVLLGSWTRINAAGLTCPDWPTCRGALIPAMGGGTLWEWTHRLLAVSLAPLIVAVFVVAWRHRGRCSMLAGAAVAIAALFVAQVALGAATVNLDNSPISVVLHWGTAMAVIATLTALAIFAGELDAREGATSAPVASAVPATMLAVTAAVAFVTMCIGAYVSSSGAGLACLSIPGCAGNVVVYTPGQTVQMLHRLAAAATLLCATGAFALVWMKAVTSRVRAAASIGLFLVFIQVLLGLLNVSLRLPMDLREIHAANAALVFLSFVAATAFALNDLAPQAAVRER
jgi:heme A synthase